MTFKIKESFEWLAPEFKVVDDAGKNTIRIKGIALRSNVVSRNKRKYVDEELKMAARTWIGKPVTINHDPKRTVGNVVWMEYNKGALEYLADIKKNPYVTMLRDGSTSIGGVSIEANYLHNRCPKCGQKFYTEEDFHSHMRNEHFILTEPTKEVHGLVGTALSLVLSPEEPGYTGTSIELMEKYQKPLLQLLETVTNYHKEKENYMKKIHGKAAVSNQKRITIDEAKRLTEQEPRSDAERAKAHFNITDEEWNKLSDAEKQAYIDKLPPRGSAKEQVEEEPKKDEQSQQNPPTHPVETEKPPEDETLAQKADVSAKPTETGHTPPEQKILEADYPWDTCISDRKADGYSEEKAKKICAAIKNRTVSHEMQYGNCTVKEAIEHVAEKIDTDKLFAYNLQRFAEQFEAPTVAADTTITCPEGFHPNDLGTECVADPVPEVTPPVEAPVVSPPETPSTLGEQVEIPVGDVHGDAPVPHPVPLADVTTPKCPEGSHMDAELQVCVPDEIQEQPSGEAPVASSTKLLEAKLPPLLKLGEPFANYADFADCVSKNQDKGDPDAYCADIKRKVEGETLKESWSFDKAYIRDVQLSTAINKLNEAVAKLAKQNLDMPQHFNVIRKDLAETRMGLQRLTLKEAALRGKYDRAIFKHLAALNKQFVNANKETNRVLEHYSKVNGKLATAIAKNTRLATEQKGDFEKILALADRNAKEMQNKIKTLEEWKQIKEQEPPQCGENEHWDAEQNKCVPNAEAPSTEEIRKLKETFETRIDNLEAKLKGTFKAHTPSTPTKTKPDEYYADPVKRRTK